LAASAAGRPRWVGTGWQGELWNANNPANAKTSGHPPLLHLESSIWPGARARCPVPPSGHPWIHPSAGNGRNRQNQRPTGRYVPDLGRPGTWCVCWCAQPAGWPLPRGPGSRQVGRPSRCCKLGSVRRSEKGWPAVARHSVPVWPWPVVPSLCRSPQKSQGFKDHIDHATLPHSLLSICYSFLPRNPSVSHSASLRTRGLRRSRHFASSPRFARFCLPKFRATNPSRRLSPVGISMSHGRLTA